MKLIIIILICFVTTTSVVRIDDSWKVESGVGIKDLIEVGKPIDWTDKFIKAAVKLKRSKNSDCIRIRGKYKWQHYLSFPDLGIKAYYNKFIRPHEFDMIQFDKNFNGQFEHGITIGKTTRKEIYSIYGKKEFDNPWESYDSIGIGFLFNKDWDSNDHSMDTLIAVDVYKIEK